ncbi:TIGR03032 family protein [Taklimakanibacter deserti]|uniref:TIGR03032 family protein n=1 Tax=Taklimakanibacter deserti TaxID=2267839 RepID=UPI0034D6200B
MSDRKLQPASVSDDRQTVDTVAKGDPIFAVNASRGFAAWLKQHKASLAVTTYQVGKLLMFGVKADGQLWVFNRNIGRCLGLAVKGNELWATADTQIFKFVDAMEPGQRSSEGHDALYVPQMSFFTGDLDIHDLALLPDGIPLFVNTLFNGLARPSATHSFVPVWQPSFITRLAAEDRCHLNGLALKDGKPAFVTAVARSDTFDGWRDQRQNGGIVIDVASGEVVCSGLSMPHSPRWHGGKLWLLNSGTGELGTVDLAAGRFEALCFCPGYLRGLDFIGDIAVVGLSKPRDNKTFSGLALDQQLADRKMEPRCGLYFIDTKSGSVVHSLTMEGVVSELYDVAVLRGKTQPAAIGPLGPELKRTISIGGDRSGQTS